MITTSEMAAADPYFSLLGSIRARREGIKREWEYACQTAQRVRALPMFAQKAQRVLTALDEMEGLLDIPSSITHTLGPHAEHLPEEGPEAIPLSGHVPDAMQLNALRLVRKQFRELGSSTDLKNRIFGLGARGRSYPPIWLRHAMDQMKSKGALGRLAEQKWRICEEITQRAEEGWYIVFNTLTVDNQSYEDVFRKGSFAWRNYIQSVDRIVGTEVHGSVRKALSKKADSPFHSYVAIVERGGQHGRLHIHVIHCLREIPDSWKEDPNRSVGPPKNRQVFGMKKLWQHGHSMPVACRFSDFDAFGRLGWVWPVKLDGVKFKPFPAKPPLAIARYMCKYLAKSYCAPKGDYLWRMRISHGFGLGRMRRTIEGISRETLWNFLSESPARITMDEIRLPTTRLRIECLRSLLKLNRNGKRESVSSLSRLQTMRKSLMAVSPRPPIGEQLRSLMRPTITSSSPSTGTSVLQYTNDMGGFDVESIFREAFRRPVERFTAKAGTARN